ncbi:hypothetical protein BZA05DRAFT_472091 [Tricharina praecox]|uniref:uncharacterized protein n=1 Tax=Tricharina praecox TaxID=43433 RepID=UPI002220C6AB|nr:uncharacterized protein BZA05DRAFT_472091 [Tricharina praecox]KAI5855181.1 hypothetical protein BZA05DRAFT_472091 [Tricharina praecox]
MAVAPKCFRISAVPPGWSDDDLFDALRTVDPSLHNRNDLSLYPACCGSTQTALLNLHTYSQYFHSIDVNKSTYERVAKTAVRTDALLVIDCHFYDFTPLNTPDGNILADVVAVTGLAGVCVWILAQPRNPKMWLKDFLPRDVKNIRIMTYGYESSLTGPRTSSTKMVDYRTHFIQQLKNSRSGAENRPIIFVGHSLGGILILQALVDSTLKDPGKSILGATQGIFFFGTPHQGLRVEELQSMVEEGSDTDRQRLNFLAQLEEGSDFLVNQIEVLAPIWQTFQRCIISFYETMKAPTVKKEAIGAVFFHAFLDHVLLSQRKLESPSKLPGDRYYTLPELLDADDHAQMDALLSVLQVQQPSELSMIIDRLYMVVPHGDQLLWERFVTELSTFIANLSGSGLKVRVLLTSLPQTGVPAYSLSECLNAFHFDNTRYGKISREHHGSLEWLWSHQKYRNWSTSESSSLLCIGGKPGSRKSTLVKYFKDNLLEREPQTRPTIIASFFYSFREGERQTSHYNMLRSILYDVLSQNKFLFCYFQREYWKYQAFASGRNLLDDRDPMSERLHFIIDAVDESDESDRHDILRMFFELCSKKECTVKVFFASRPVAELEDFIKSPEVIRMQDMNKPDILNFVDAFLGPELGFSDDILRRATGYILENAHGVFLWVHLVKKELLRYSARGCSKGAIFRFLESLPTELEGLYQRMFDELQGGSEEDIIDGIKMFRFILFSRQSPTVAELQHALAVPDGPGDEFGEEDFQDCMIIDMEKRIVHCGRNFSESKDTTSPVFRLPTLIICAANTTPEEGSPGTKSWVLRNFEDYVRYLDSRPLLNYAMSFLRSHMQDLEGYPTFQLSALVSALVEHLTPGNPATYLFGDWAHNSFSDFGEDTASTGRFKRSMLLTAELDDKTLLVVVAQNGHDSTIRIILACGGRMETQTPLGQALHVAALGRRDSTVRLLIDGGANPEAMENHRRTALHLAAKSGYDTTVQLLLDHGAKIEAKDKWHNAALHLATMNRKDSTVQLLIDRGANTEAMNKHERTALHLAATNGHDSIVQLLLDHGANINAKDKEHDTALHIAVMTKSEDTLLFEAGNVALHLALMGGHDSTIQLLLDHGAHIGAHDNYGLMTRDLATMRGHKSTARLFADFRLKQFQASVAAHTPESWSNSNLQNDSNRYPHLGL